MKQQLLRILICMLPLMVACNNSLNIKYDKTTFKEDISHLEKNGHMDSSDAALVTMYIFLGEMMGSSFEGRTYSQILRDAHAFEKVRDKRSG